MKTRKKTAQRVATSIDDIIAGGSSTQLEENLGDQKKKDGRGRPKSKVPKKTCVFRLPMDVIEAIDSNCRGNKSVFAEEIFRNYFKQSKIDL